MLKSIASSILALSVLGACNSPTTPAPASTTVKSTGPGGSLVCGCGGDCTSTAGDGVPDTWKTIGIDSTCSGKVDLDLSALGASPTHKDVFLQIDYMTMSPAGKLGFPDDSNKPTETAIGYIVQAFKDAPVSNPDGTTGIHLHVITGSEVPYHEVVTLDPHATAACAGTDFEYLGNIKSKYMDKPHSLIFHYGLMVNDSTTPESGIYASACPVDPVCGGKPSAGSTGMSEIGGTDFIVSLGAYWNWGWGGWTNPSNPDPKNEEYRDPMVAATIMHELGHNFGLMHGGLTSPTDANQTCNAYKPNYISVMNYNNQLYQIPALTQGPITFTGTSLHFRIDYSRERLPDLNESALDETAGLASSDPDLQIIYQDSTGNMYVGNSTGPIDWNNNGQIDSSPVSADIDHNGTSSDLLEGGEDWSKLKYGWYSNQNPPSLKYGQRYFAPTYNQQPHFFAE